MLNPLARTASGSASTVQAGCKRSGAVPNPLEQVIEPRERVRRDLRLAPLLGLGLLPPAVKLAVDGA